MKKVIFISVILGLSMIGISFAQEQPKMDASSIQILWETAVKCTGLTVETQEQVKNLKDLYIKNMEGKNYVQARQNIQDINMIIELACVSEQEEKRAVLIPEDECRQKLIRVDSEIRRLTELRADSRKIQEMQSYRDTLANTKCVEWKMPVQARENTQEDFERERKIITPEELAQDEVLKSLSCDQPKVNQLAESIVDLSEEGAEVMRNRIALALDNYESSPEASILLRSASDMVRNHRIAFLENRVSTKRYLCGEQQLKELDIIESNEEKIDLETLYNTLLPAVDRLLVLLWGDISDSRDLAIFQTKIDEYFDNRSPSYEESIASYINTSATIYNLSYVDAVGLLHHAYREYATNVTIYSMLDVVDSSQIALTFHWQGKLNVWVSLYASDRMNVVVDEDTYTVSWTDLSIQIDRNGKVAAITWRDEAPVYYAYTWGEAVNYVIPVEYENIIAWNSEAPVKWDPKE